jgi:uncharacterized protein with NRDE domain
MTTCHPRYRLVLAFNRDEFYWRPTSPLSKWNSGVIAGRDLTSRGTWLATANGRWAFVTNNQGGAAPVHARARRESSRGELPVEFVTARRSAKEAAEMAGADSRRYRPFHLVVGDERGQTYWVNAGHANASIQHLAGDAVGFASAGGPAANWMKVTTAVRDFDQLVSSSTDIKDEQLFDLLGHRRPIFQSFPTVRETAMRAALSSRKVRLGVYGTRSTTVLLIERGTGRTRMSERRFRWSGSTSTRVVVG